MTAGSGANDASRDTLLISPEKPLSTRLEKAYKYKRKAKRWVDGEYKKGGLLLRIIANCDSFHFENILFHGEFICIRIMFYVILIYL